MNRVLPFVAACLLCACGSDSPVRPSRASTPSPPPAATTAPSVGAISPASAIAGSSNITLEVTGTHFIRGSPNYSFVLWSANGVETDLLTTFSSDTRLTALVSDELLSTPGTASVRVMNGDSMGFTDGYRGYPVSNAVAFAVLPRPESTSR